MCNLLNKKVPKGWQQVCQKARMDPGSSLPCALYLSPNGRTFRTKKEVDDFEAILEEGRRMKREKKMLKSGNVGKKGSLVKRSESKRESGRKIEEKPLK